MLKKNLLFSVTFSSAEDIIKPLESDHDNQSKSSEAAKNEMLSNLDPSSERTAFVSDVTLLSSILASATDSEFNDPSLSVAVGSATGLVEGGTLDIHSPNLVEDVIDPLLKQQPEGSSIAPPEGSIDSISQTDSIEGHWGSISASLGSCSKPVESKVGLVYAEGECDISEANGTNKGGLKSNGSEPISDPIISDEKNVSDSDKILHDSEIIETVCLVEEQGSHVSQRDLSSKANPQTIAEVSAASNILCSHDDEHEVGSSSQIKPNLEEFMSTQLDAFKQSGGRAMRTRKKIN